MDYSILELVPVPGKVIHMAGLVTGESSCQGAADDNSWYMSREEIVENSPSRKDGIDWKKETDYRRSYCKFLWDLGTRLELPQSTIATAIIFCHRFFLQQSHAKNDRTVGCCTLFYN
ncbi:hypothetical protein RIF29_29426 [Crotalaria pallida]|uniref:B-like cyclin n=1 Tax=Crotalaria pallida TaxID=3830 RepID=A0AAN9HVX1_CROPI